MKIEFVVMKTDGDPVDWEAYKWFPAYEDAAKNVEQEIKNNCKAYFYKIEKVWH